MRFQVIIRYMGIVLLLNSVFMLISAFISLFYGGDSASYPLLLGFLISALLGSFPLIFVPHRTDISSKEGYIIVVGAWILSCFMGMLPYVLWGGEFTVVNAWFESVSGFTTTGSTLLQDVEALPKGLLFWRSSTHWLGGMGVVMFVLVVLPSIGRTKATLSSVELSPLAKDNYRYKTQKILQILALVYVGLTLSETILLKVAGMDWFDAVNHSFSTVATGGFSTKNMSVAYYDNVWIDIIITIFMTVSGMHFGLIFATLVGKKNNIFRSEVARFYVLCLVIFGLIISFSIWAAGIYPTLASAIRYGMFQMASIITTTGFATADTNLWTPLAMLILIYFTFQCACAGSTAGGIKSDRILLMFKSVKARIIQQQHPNAVIRIKLNNITQDNSVVSLSLLYIVFYVFIVLIGTFFIILTGVDLLTAFTAAATCMGNVGPGFGMVGSLDNFSQLPAMAKITCSMLMLLGRLEVFGFIHLILMKFWR